MVSESPFQGTRNSVSSLGVSADLEVPQTCRAANNELSHSDDEGVDPEKTKDVVQENPSSLDGPFDVGHKSVIGMRFGLTN